MSGEIIVGLCAKHGKQNGIQIASSGCNFHLIMPLVVVVPTPLMVLPTLDSSHFLAKDGKQKAAECT
jgi:hypothetical protein